MRRNVYTVAYILFKFDNEKTIDVIAANKAEAYDLATFEEIPKVTGEIPYATRVSGVTYKNGNHKEFNTIFGDPY